MRDVAGYAVPGTRGWNLPPFEDMWLETWAEMVRPKIEAWERERTRAEGVEEKKMRERAKL